MEYQDQNNIKSYKEILEIMTTLKAVQQLSWDITNVTKRYPLDTISENDLPDVLETLRDLRKRHVSLLLQSNNNEPF